MNYKQLIYDFNNCFSWEERYLYLIDLGQKLPLFPNKYKISKYLISDCQSQVWIVLTSHNNKVNLQGYSDALIVKGLIALIFILYKNLSLSELINFNVYSLLNDLNLNKYLTVSRSNGLNSIIKNIKNQARKILNVYN
ncbi:MAG: SufE family protein [Candidatus Lightella neohaematopini]|nr:SufE family protein [Candidatus Lightella neohaematopini]MCV2528877.1 SufE family protein [Candidatus Lightella neohaematopini]